MNPNLSENGKKILLMSAFKELRSLSKIKPKVTQNGRFLTDDHTHQQHHARGRNWYRFFHNGHHTNANPFLYGHHHPHGGTYQNPMSQMWQQHFGHREKKHRFYYRAHANYAHQYDPKQAFFLPPEMESGIKFRPHKGKMWHQHLSPHHYDQPLGEFRETDHGGSGHHSGGDGAAGGGGDSGHSLNYDPSGYQPRFKPMKQQLQEKKQTDSIQTASLGQTPVAPVEEAPAEVPEPEIATPEPTIETPESTSQPAPPVEAPPQPPAPPTIPAILPIAAAAIAVPVAVAAGIGIGKAIHHAITNNSGSKEETQEEAAEGEGEEEGEGEGEAAEEEAGETPAGAEDVMAEAGLEADTMAMLGAGALGVAALAGAGLLAAGLAGMMSETDMLRKKKEMLEDELEIEKIVIDEFDKYLDELKGIKNEFWMLGKNVGVETDQLCNYFDFTVDQMTETLNNKKDEEDDVFKEI